MSDTDSFIEEVNDEVRRDRLYGYLRRYGWIAILVVVLIVGGAAWSEYRKAQQRAQAEGLGDAMLAALAANDSAERVTALASIEPGAPSSAAILQLMTAAEQADAGDTAAAVDTLNALSLDGDVPAIYRQIAQFKSITLQGDTTPAADRRQALEAMAQPGNLLRLLATEQLALIDISEGDAEAAIAKYQMIISDAETTSDLQQRARQVIVALGGAPELDNFNNETSDAPAQTGN
ncbi:MAG: tetratricopeptide repeat protein [Sulfitobacter sp.]